MPPPKRKRSERIHEPGRPSPHRPAETPMAQRDYNNMDSPGRGGRGGGRGGRRNDRRESYHNNQNHNQQNQNGQSANNFQQPPSPAVARPPPAAAAAAPAAPAPQQAAPTPTASAAAAAAATLPSPTPSNYAYDILTDDKISSWAESAKKVAEHGAQSREDVDIVELSNLFQEFIQSIVDNRLDPTAAGHCVREIIGPESTEIIKDSYSFEPHKLFLDTLSTVAEELMEQPSDADAAKLRAFLIASGISTQLMRQILDTPLLQKLGLIRDTFARAAIRSATNLLYRQANYNLLREESEGYSKLLTELFMSFTDVSSSEIPSTEEAEVAFERIKALIGTFDIDVGRVLDVALDVYATSVVKASKFFVKLLRVSSWWPRTHAPVNAVFAGGLPQWAVPNAIEQDEETVAELKRQRDVQFWDRARERQIQAWFELGGRQVTEEDLSDANFLKSATAEEAEAARKWMDVTKTLPPQGNRVAAQLLGFKLRFYASDFRDDEVLPANLLYLAALLIKIGFISIVDLYPHLWPYDSEMEEFKTEKMKEVEAEERKKRGGGQPNALLSAGALPDDPVPGMPSSRLPTKPSGDKPAAEAAKEKPVNKPMEQKGALVTSLLTIGAIPEALFMLGLWPWLIEAFPEISDRINRILEFSIEKIYQESRPIPTGPTNNVAKRIPDIDQNGVPKGSIRLSELPTRKAMRWPYPDGRQGNGDQPYRFFWDDWADNVPVCQNLDDLLALCNTLLKMSGANIGKSPKLLSKLLAIGRKSLGSDKSQQNLDRWQDLLTRFLVPALSATEASVAASDAIWSLLKLYPVATRFAIYAEWFEGATSRQPAIKACFARTKAATLGVMKRISNKNLTDSAKTLAKTSHSSPGIVCKVALEQISSYANLTDAMVECAKYFTELSKDVLVWSLLGALGTNQRSRTQASYILSVSAWLQALSGFTGKVFKRYTDLDVTPILQYVNDQLFHGKSTDLIILTELTLSMGGIVKMIDISDEQVQAMSGLAMLQRYTLQNMRDNRFNSTVSSKRLMQALVDSKLAGRLLINIAQFRQSASFRLADDGAHIKFLSTMMDNSHQILIQYLDLLRTNMEPDEFDKVVPSISQMMVDFGLDASLAFMIGRESLAVHIFSKAAPVKAKVVADKEGDVAMGDDSVPVDTSTPQEDSQATSQKDDSQSAASGLIDVVQPVIDSIIATTPAAIWTRMSAEFFVIFWALQLRDIQVPWKSYSSAQERYLVQWRELSKDRSGAGLAAKEAKKAKVLTDSKLIMEEGHEQKGRAAKAKIHITRRFSDWFPGSVESLNGASDAIIEQCLFPRLVISKMDCEYAYSLVKLLHEWSCPNFRLRVLCDRLFNANRLRAMLFTCTVGEAELLGRFFHHILRDMAKWHEDKALYEKEAIAKTDANPHGRLGFGDKFNDEGKATSHIQHEDFRGILFGWHKSMNVALKACLTGTEWMHIRNAISFITAVHEFFPAIDFMGEQLYAQFDAIAKREEHSREDLSTLSNGVLSVLARRKSKWVRIQAFRNTSGKDAKNEGTQLRPNAPSFQPRNGDAEDGEVKDGAKSNSMPATTHNGVKSLPPRVPARDKAGLPHNTNSGPPTARPSPAPPSSIPSRHATPAGGPQNRGTNRAPPPGLPARPPGPIPDVHQGRFGAPAQPERRDREPRDTRGNREPREPRGAEPVREQRGRDFSHPERRLPDAPPGGPGRLNERERPARPEQQPPRRDTSVPARERPASTERKPVRGRTPEAGRGPRDAPAQAASTSAPAKGEEPPMNPARAALFNDSPATREGRPPRDDRPERPDRPERGDRPGHRERKRPGEQDTPEVAKTDRAAQFQDSGPRPARDDPRDRMGARTGSPARGRRQDLHDAPREDFRGPQQDRRPHPRDPRGEGFQPPHPRGQERDDRAPVESSRDAFLNREHDHSRTRQDDSYGRLNPIQSVLSETPNNAPSGPRGRGSGRGSRNNVNTPPPPPRFPGHNDNPNTVAIEERQPPTGPGGRGRQHHTQGSMSTPMSADRPPHQTPSSAGPPGPQDTPSVGVHPSRMAQINGPGPSPAGGSGPGPRPPRQHNTPDRGPPGPAIREQQGGYHSSSSQSLPMAPPTGPGGSERSKGPRRQLDGINTILEGGTAGNRTRRSIANSDAQVLTGGSPVTTPAHEKTNPIPERTSSNGGEGHTRGDRERSHRDRERGERSGRSSRRHSQDRAARDRERTPGGRERDRESKEYRERRSEHSAGHSSGGAREERDRDSSRRSAREPSGSMSRPEPRVDPRANAMQAAGVMDPMGPREPRTRHSDRGGGEAGGRHEEWGGGGSMRGGRNGHRDGGQRPGDGRLEPQRDDRSRKRRSDDATGFQPDNKRPRH
ncbi:THO complex subunit 2 [Plectosphaerella cucumerina]|uniref:THO complex subunit 2 n=1 Tax=Plectosphaerella cucumerina TaxID=40658 RepID=A0A8K0X0Q9_9PEZI|nr:THO complex subunit 2 [Plectosphaerella cucumerina]